MSEQPWCHGNKQRVRLLCCCRPLSSLAMRLAREVDREGGCRLQWSADMKGGWLGRRGRLSVHLTLPRFWRGGRSWTCFCEPL